MSKAAILAVFGATLVLGACSKHHSAPEPVPGACRGRTRFDQVIPFVS